jgi:hypothetical protein
MTTAIPAHRPAGTSMMSPGRRPASDAATSSRRSAFLRLACPDSTSDSRRRSRAYSMTSSPPAASA